MFRNSEEVDGESRYIRNLEQVVPADSQCFPSSRPINNTGLSNSQQPIEENNFEGYPKFQRQSSFRKQSPKSSLNQTVPPNHITNPVDLLNSFQERLNSFQGKWPDWATIPIYDIAKAGMRYIGPEDKVQCDYCRGILYSWDDGDSPLEEHQKHFPLCSFLQERCWEILNREIEQDNISKKATVEDKRDNFSEVASEYANLSEQINEPILFTELHKVENPNSSEASLSTFPMANVAIDIVRNMGYDDDMIQKAVTILSNDVSHPELNSGNLLDILFSIEDSMDLINDSDEDINCLDEQLRRHAHIDDRSSTSTWNNVM